MTKKDKKIIEKAEKENIPIFVFIANDKLSVNTNIGIFSFSAFSIIF